MELSGSSIISFLHKKHESSRIFRFGMTFFIYKKTSCKLGVTTQPKNTRGMYKNILQDKSKLAKLSNGSHFLLRQSQSYLRKLEHQLDAQIDKRLVRTFFNLFVAILTFRNRSMGLLLSELGAYICGPSKAAAGTKRISNLLRSKKWGHQLIDDFLFNRAKVRVEDLVQEGQRPLLLWDDSRIEKHESWWSEALCSVWSSKGKRLTKIRKGFYRPPASRICVPGFKWTAVTLSHIGGIPSVVQMTWWTTRGKYKEWGGNIVYRLLRKIHQQMGRVATHVLDRGYAHYEMLDWLFRFEQDFIIRWKKNHLLNHPIKGCKKTHLLSRSFQAVQSRMVWDKERKKAKRIIVAWAQVQHPEFPDQSLCLVIIRDKKNFNSPMYLLTNLEVLSSGQAWQIGFSYFHRWQIEQTFRFCKSELAMESPRLWFWENRLKFLAIVTLVYDLLLQLLRKRAVDMQIIIQKWCPRTGNRHRKASIPIYRLRAAISWCLFFALAQNSG